tara:strand:- start:139 stop:396 length:258 start_codon:yes stop_codon:yes gene_type:complete
MTDNKNLNLINKRYIMDENLFQSLASNVNGFTNVNGNNYLEHIVLIFKLDGENKKKILEAPSIKEAKHILETQIKINITHEYYIF